MKGKYIMFNKLKKALEGFVEDVVTDFAESKNLSAPPASTTTTSDNTGNDALNMALPVFKRVSKAPAVYEPITSLTTDDIPKLIEALDDPDPQQQVHAIEMAHILMKKMPSQIYTISETLALVMLSDPDAPARAAAAEALNVVKRPIQRAQHTEAKIEYEMQNLRYKEVHDALIQALLEDDDLLTRQNAAETLTKIGVRTHTEFSTLINEQGTELDPFIHMIATVHISPQFMGNFVKRQPDEYRKQIEDGLIQAYLDYPEMESSICETIQVISLERVIPYLLKTYRENEAVSSRNTIARTLGLIDSPDSLQPLLVMMRADNAEIGRQALQSLAQLKQSDAIKPLQAFKATLSEQDGRHILIEKALVSCGDTSSLDEHFNNLKSNNLLKQKAAIAALGASSSEASIDALTDYLKAVDNQNMAYEVFRILINHPSDKVAYAMIDSVCNGILGYRQVSHNFVSKMRMPHAIQWLDKAVDERATPEAMIQIKKDRALLKRF